MNKVAVVRLSADGTSGSLTRTITADNFDVPTTVARFGGSLYLPNARFGQDATEFSITRVRRRGLTRTTGGGPGHAHTRRTRIAPRAVEGSTTVPPWVISTSPAATRRRAARRAGSICSRQASSPATARAASEGQIVFPRPRESSSRRIAASSARSVSVTP